MSSTRLPHLICSLFDICGHVVKTINIVSLDSILKVVTAFFLMLVQQICKGDINLKSLNHKLNLVAAKKGFLSV